MKIIQVFTGKPGIYLYYMFLWVVIWIPGEYHIVTGHFPYLNYSIEYITKYIIPFALCFIMVPLLNLVTGLLWKRINCWVKYIIITGCYSVIAWLSIFLTVLFHEFGYVEYAGDVFGTIVMVYWPTIILYWIVGIPAVIFFRHKAKKSDYGSLIRKYIYGPGMDKPVAMVNVSGNGNRFYSYADAQGSIRLLSNSAGNIKESYTYDPYGRPRVMRAGSPDGNWLTEDTAVYASSHPLLYGNPYLFTGRRWDSTTELYYYRMRDYSPDAGRFMQADPAGYIDGMNLYAYCGNNPINWIDPWGLCKNDDKSIGEKIIDAIEALENSAAGEVLNSMNDGFCAWIDGVIPFGDPLDDTYEGMGFSKGMGHVSRDAALAAAGAGAAKFNPWLGKTAVHGPHGGAHNYRHLQFMIRIGRHSTGHFRIPLWPK